MASGVAWDLRIAPLNGTQLGLHSKDNKIFAAEPELYRGDFELDPALVLPVHRRFALLGLGLCPGRRARRPRQGAWAAERRLREPSLETCLERCSSEGHRCEVVSFSQVRSECILGRLSCTATQLTPHASYATFARARGSATDNVGGLVEVAFEQRPGSGRGEEGAPSVRVYAAASPSFQALLSAFASSLGRAAALGDAAVLFLHNATKDDTSNSQAGIPWPSGPQDYLDMRSRDRRKINRVVRAVFESLGQGPVVVSDIDVQVFPGWAALVRACTAVAHVCLTQQEGYFPERRFPFNSGFVAFRAGWVALGLLLELASHYERPFLVEDGAKLEVAYPLEQDVLSAFLFDRGRGLWATFNPEYVKIFVDAIPESDILRLKVQHACGSAAGPRLPSMYRVRRLYYGVLPYCGGDRWKQEPCCALFGGRAAKFAALQGGGVGLPLEPPGNVEERRMQPFALGFVFGPPPLSWKPLTSKQKLMRLLQGATDQDVDRLLDKCEEMKMAGMKRWQQEHPQDSFMLA